MGFGGTVFKFATLCAVQRGSENTTFIRNLHTILYLSLMEALLDGGSRTEADDSCSAGENSDSLFCSESSRGGTVTLSDVPSAVVTLGEHVCRSRAVQEPLRLEDL